MLVALVPGLAIGGEFFAQTEWKLLCVSLAAFCLVAGIARISLARDARKDGLLTQWGDASYGLYLIHNAVIALVFNALIGVRQVRWLAGIVGLFAIGMGAGLLYGQLEHRVYGFLKARLPRAPWHRGPRMWRRLPCHRADVTQTSSSTRFASQSIRRLRRPSARGYVASARQRVARATSSNAALRTPGPSQGRARRARAS
jgi:hypothetical protein